MYTVLLLIHVGGTQAFAGLSLHCTPSKDCHAFLQCLYLSVSVSHSSSSVFRVFTFLAAVAPGAMLCGKLIYSSTSNFSKAFKAETSLVRIHPRDESYGKGWLAYEL